MTGPAAGEPRQFEVNGEAWIAWPSGGGAYGTGGCGAASVEAIHFARDAAPDVPVFEALLAAGRFWTLFDDELIHLFQSAVRVVDPSELPEKPVRRRSRSLEP